MSSVSHLGFPAWTTVICSSDVCCVKDVGKVPAGVSCGSVWFFSLLLSSDVMSGHLIYFQNEDLTHPSGYFLGIRRFFSSF